MWFWLIPYLVAYQSTDSNILKYGPEAVFKVQVHSNATLVAPGDTIDVTSWHSNVTIHLVCRPLESPYVECRMVSAILDSYALSGKDEDRKVVRNEPAADFGLGNITFQLKFHEDGVSKIWFLNTKGSFRRDMVRAIVSNFNLGIRAHSLKNFPQEILEKSVIGTCKTILDIDESPSLREKESETPVDGYKLYYRHLGKDADDDDDDEDEDRDDDFFVLEKHRKMNDCIETTPYLFGNDDDMNMNEKQRKIKVQTNIISSRSRFTCGRRSFSSYTENFGTETFSSTSKTQKAYVGEFIRVSLEEIRAAKTRLLHKPINTGVGYEPGIPWPERGITGRSGDD